MSISTIHNANGQHFICSTLHFISVPSGFFWLASPACLGAVYSSPRVKRSCRSFAAKKRRWRGSLSTCSYVPRVCVWIQCSCVSPEAHPWCACERADPEAPAVRSLGYVQSWVNTCACAIMYVHTLHKRKPTAMTCAPFIPWAHNLCWAWRCTYAGFTRTGLINFHAVQVQVQIQLHQQIDKLQMEDSPCLWGRTCIFAGGTPGKRKTSRRCSAINGAYSQKNPKTAHTTQSANACLGPWGGHGPPSAELKNQGRRCSGKSCNL